MRSLFIGVCFLLFFGGSDLNSQHNIKHGGALPSFRTADINGKVLSPFDKGNTYVLFLFCDPINTYDRFVLFYAQSVYKRYRSSGLEIIGISNKGNEQTKNLVEMYNIEFPFIGDSDKQIHALFGINTCCGGIVLAHIQKGIQFTSDHLLSEENLRQLVENAVLGKIHYQFPSPSEQSTFHVGDNVPQLELFDLQKHASVNLAHFASQDLIINYFASFCDQCKAGKRIQMLQKLNTTLSKMGWHPKIMIVFQKPFNQEDIAEIRKRLSIPYAVYLAENILPDDQKYITDNSLKNDPFMVVIKMRKVTYVEKIDVGEHDIIEDIMLIANAQRRDRYE